MRATNTPSFLVLCVAYHVVFALVSSHHHHHHHRGLPVFVRANQPVVRFRNKTVGILAEGGGNVFVSSDNVTIAGDVEVTTANDGTVNVTEKMDLLTDLQNDMGKRVVSLAGHGDMDVVCNPEGTEYRARDFETGAFGDCMCRALYAGESCDVKRVETCDAVVKSSDGVDPKEWISLGSCSFTDVYEPISVSFVGVGVSVHSFLIVEQREEEEEEEEDANANARKYVAAYQSTDGNCYMTSFEIKMTEPECSYRLLESRKHSQSAWSYDSTCNGKNRKDLIDNHWLASNAVDSTIATASSESGFGISSISFMKCSKTYDERCPVLSTELNGKNWVDIGTCNNLDDVKFVRAYQQGTSMYPRFPTTGNIFHYSSTNSSSTFVIAHQSQDNYCKMVQMELSRDDSSQMCSVKLLNAGYTNSQLSSSTCYTREQVVNNWNNRRGSSVATTQSGSSYGVREIDFKICSTYDSVGGSVIADESKNGKKCGVLGNTNRVFDLRNGDAKEAWCIDACEADDDCVAFSGVFGSWCIGCKVALDTAQTGATAYKKS